MKIFFKTTILSGAMMLGTASPLLAQVPDLTKDAQAVDRKATYNLGATGLRGWIYTKAADNLDAAQGRTTLASRQILVTHVGAASPADGVVKVDDVIIGVDGKPFNDDARKSIALAIQEAETDAKGGVLKLMVSRGGQVQELALKLAVMGTYSDTAPWNCAKSKRIFEKACEVLDKEKLTGGWTGSVQGLALLATGNPAYLPKLKDLARSLSAPEADPNKKPDGVIWGNAWDLGYRNLFLCEYFMITRDQEVLPKIEKITLSLARGQSMYGTFGHGYAALTKDGKYNGSVPPYGPVNAAGLPANLSLVLAKKCGVKHPELDRAIARAAGFFGYFTDKGSIPYGEHAPWPYHENNGKNSITAVMFSAMGNKPKETTFFARMATAGFANREYGHTGQGFSYLWSALGAGVGGPEAAAAFFREVSWHLDLVRRSDGSFTYDGDEQYGAGKTDDGTYYGNSGYNGLSPAATYVLTYALPLHKLVITGRDADRSGWLDKEQAAAAVASGRFDLDRRAMSPVELVAAFSDWSPIVRGWAAEELSKRPESKTMIAGLIKLADSGEPHQIQGACETLGLLNTPEALPVLVKQLSNPDRWVRYKAAAAIKKMGGTAKPALEEHSQGACFHCGAGIADPQGGSRSIRPRSTGRRCLQRSAQERSQSGGSQVALCGDPRRIDESRWHGPRHAREFLSEPAQRGRRDRPCPGHSRRRRKPQPGGHHVQQRDPHGGFEGARQISFQGRHRRCRRSGENPGRARQRNPHRGNHENHHQLRSSRQATDSRAQGSDRCVQSRYGTQGIPALVEQGSGGRGRGCHPFDRNGNHAA